MKLVTKKTSIVPPLSNSALKRLAAQTVLFEPNDPVTRRRFRVALSSALREKVRAGEVKDFRVECNSRLNPPAVIDRNVLYAVVRWIPARGRRKRYHHAMTISVGECL